MRTNQSTRPLARTSYLLLGIFAIYLAGYVIESSHWHGKWFENSGVFGPGH